MDAKQQKTFVGIILIVLLGAFACCGLTVAVGALVGYQEAKKLDLAFSVDAGDAWDEPPPGDDDDFEAREAALRQRFADEVLAGLADAGHPEYAYQPQSYDLVTDGGALINLGNLYEEYLDQLDEDRPQFVDRTVRGFFPAEIPASWDAARPHLVATVRDRIFVELLALRDLGPLTVLQRPLSDNLVELVVYDGADSMQYLNEAHLKDWKKSAEEVFQAGRAQLAERSSRPFKRVSPGVFESAWADNHDVGRALLFDKLRKLKLKGDPVLFLPQRDHLVITGADDVKGLEAAADLVSEYLDLPRANSGRGWRLGKQGLSPWAPPAREALFQELALEAGAQDANEQKKALDEKFEREGLDLFVATTLFTDDDDGAQRTYCVWTKDADSLLPRTEFVVFVDLDKPEADRVVAAAPWDEVMKKVGAQVSPDRSYWPLRYRVKTFPNARTLRALGTHPLFKRDRDEE